MTGNQLYVEWDLKETWPKRYEITFLIVFYCVQNFARINEM